MVDLTNAQVKQAYEDALAGIKNVRGANGTGAGGGGDRAVNGLPIAIGVEVTILGTTHEEKITGSTNTFLAIDNKEGVMLSSSQIVRRGNGLDIDYTAAPTVDEALAYFLVAYTGKRLRVKSLITRPTTNGIQNVALWEVVG